MFFVWALLLIAVLGGISPFFFRAMGSQLKHRDILIDLGLQRGVTGEENPPYYKWGWRKTSRDRIWGERIVRKAFEKGKLWLSPDDLVFFEAKSQDFEAGRTINKEMIRERVELIAKRSKYISSCARSLVREVVQYVLSTSPSEAELILSNQGMRGETHDSLSRLARHELRRRLKQAGLQILGIDGQGLNLIDEKGEVISRLKGLEGWEQLLRAYRQESIDEFSRRVYAPYNTAFAAVKNSVLAGLYNDFVHDQQESRVFLSHMELEVDHKEVPLSMEEVVKLEAILYSWHFGDGLPFNYLDHKRIRELVLNRGLSAQFRVLVVRSLKTDAASLYQLLSLFPRRVIFYGSHARARAFAAEQYIFHLERLFESLPRHGSMDLNPPLILRIWESDVEKCRSAETENRLTTRLPGSRGSTPARPLTLTGLLEREKSLSLEEKNLSMEAAENRGWILDLPLYDLTEEELSMLEQPPYRSYLRFLCDVQGDIDFDSNAYSAKKQRVVFFNMLLDSLVSIPAIDTHTLAEKLAETSLSASDKQ